MAQLYLKAFLLLSGMLNSLEHLEDVWESHQSIT